MKNVISGILILLSAPAFAALTPSADLDPVSLQCAEGAGDSQLQIEFYADSIVFTPYESSFTVRTPNRAGKYHFTNARTEFTSEGVPSRAVVSGSARIRGDRADVSYDLKLASGERSRVETKNMNCAFHQIVRVNAPTKGTREACLRNNACILFGSKYYELVDGSSVKGSERLSEPGCSNEGVFCLVLNGKYFAAEIPNVQLLIWE